MDLSDKPLKWGARLLDHKYGEFGLIGPFNTREDAAASGFELTEETLPYTGCNGKPFTYTKQRGRKNPLNPVRHLVTSPVVEVISGKWVTVAGDEGEWRNRYHRKEDGPNNHRPWPPLLRDQI